MSSDLLSRIPGWEREAEVFEEKARALRQLIESVRVLNGDADRLFELADAPAADVPAERRVNQYRPEDGPRGREALRLIMSERPGEIWRLADLKREIRQRNWPSSAVAVSTEIYRMQESGEVSREGNGMYRLLPPDEAAKASVPTNVQSTDGEGQGG